MSRIPWKIKFLTSVLCLSFFLLGLWIPQSPELVVSAAGCVGHSCDGLNPQTMGCGSDATTGRSKDLVIGTAEHRISATCDAKWERTRLTSAGDRYAAGSLRFGCGDYCYARSVSSPAKISVGENVYTPMEGDIDTPTRACGKLLISGPISVPIPVSDAYCSPVN
jgi:hypothetical protein